MGHGASRGDAVAGSSITWCFLLLWRLENLVWIGHLSLLLSCSLAIGTHYYLSQTALVTSAGMCSLDPHRAWGGGPCWDEFVPVPLSRREIQLAFVPSGILTGSGAIHFTPFALRVFVSWTQYFGWKWWLFLWSLVTVLANLIQADSLILTSGTSFMFLFVASFMQRWVRDRLPSEKYLGDKGALIATEKQPFPKVVNDLAMTMLPCRRCRLHAWL